MRNADLHDLRDTDTTREIYVAESRATGIKRNRKRVLLVRGDVIAVGRLEDVVGRACADESPCRETLLLTRR